MKKLLLIAALALSGCATPYQPHGFAGGYYEMDLGNDLFEVGVNGNGFTSAQKVHSYFMRRCAELTLENKHEYFVFVDKNQNIYSQNMGTNSTSTITPNYYGGYNMQTNSQTNVVSKAASVGMIKTFKEGTQPPTAMDARVILKQFKK